MSNPTEEEILKAINESGFLFEQEVGTIIENNDFHIQTNAAFKDEDMETSREIDVKGYKRVYHNEEEKISVGLTIICECKNNLNPFVFIKRNKNNLDKSYCPPNFLFPQSEFQEPVEGKPNSYYVIPAFRHFKFNEVYPYSIAESKAVQFCKMVRKGKDWKANHDGIYDSILFPIIKCLEYFKKDDKRFLKSEWKNYFIYLPVVVLNSEIYSIESHIKPTKIESEDYLSFTRDIDSKKIKGKYLIDFVRKDGLEKYLNDYIAPFIEEFVNRIKK